MYLIDTHAITEMRRRERVDGKFAEWAASVAPADLYISTISVLELEMGLMTLEHRSPSRASPLRVWLDTKVLPAFEGRILPIDIRVARRAAALHVPQRRPERSALIAATAIVHGLSVVTRNASEFEPLGVAVLNPWHP
jgi:Predicted nucleic acid-binding protein, contains PIN domain